MPNFSDILSRKSSEIKAPKPLPPGSYVWLIEGQPRFDRSTKQQTDFVEFTCRCLQPREDVDQTALQEAGGAVGKTRRLTFWITEEAVSRLSNKQGTGFLEQLGIDGDISVAEKVSMAPGRQFIGHIRHKASQDGTRIFAEIGQTAAL
jgi:hypothetical protein